MPEIGKLYEKEDVKILILYTLKNLNRPIPKQAMADIFLNSEITDYFVLGESLTDLAETGHIATDPETGLTVLTRLGYEAVDALSSHLPHWAADKALKGAEELLSKLDRRSGAETRIEERGEGLTAVCTLTDGEELLYRLELPLPSRDLSFSVQENFKENAADLYAVILEKLSGPYHDPFQK